MDTADTPDTADRVATADALATALAGARARTLRLFARLRASLGPDGLPRYLPELSPPLWDLGHLAWRESRCLGRNPLWLAGRHDETGAHAAETDLPPADTWFDDRRVNHPARWHQMLPPAATVVGWAERTRARSLALLPTARRHPAALALFAQVLRAEQTLHEDWLGMAQTLGIDPGADAGDPAAVPAGAAPSADGVDLAPVTWGQMLAFVQAGGYAERAHWSADGWAWRKRLQLQRPRHLAAPDEAMGEPGWRRARFGQWVPLDEALPAMHLSRHEAEAWCHWAGRRLPTADEWRQAAEHTAGFTWGQVWEWVSPGDSGGDGDGGTGQLVGGSFVQPLDTPAARAQDPDRHDGFWGFRSTPAA